ncbi:MAG: alpha-2-macroglobulin, partial [Bacteroidia bacterium]|nr:alpha-2-macroglobulin [Bacteroidia bacterium]
MKKQLENQYDDKYWPSVIAANPLRSWQQPLPATNDLQQHSVEIKIDAVPVGEYLLIASNDKDFSGSKTILGARFFYVSNISYVNSNDDYFVLNRDNGQPLSNAAVQVWEQKYDYKTSKLIKEKGLLYKTDANGFFKWARKKEANNYSNFSYLLDISYKNEHLFMNDLMNDYYYYRDNIIEETKTIHSLFLFTDRSIYRPGQEVFFKGIVIAKNKNDDNTTARDYETVIYLRDANYEDVDSMKVKANEFGSFSGKFQLPSTGLNGQFSIYSNEEEANVELRVEEYKRPKFYVDYEPIKRTYKVNDKIKITGIAKAYAGNNIDGATVKYRVVRQPRFIYSWLFWRWWQPPAEEMEIAHGEIKTDKDGKFIVAFTAIPDLKIEKKFEPVFDYTLYADVTDINGETRSGETMVSVSYKSLLLKVTTPESIPADSLKTFYIRTENMNGEFEPANVKVTITKLKEEKRLIRERYWDRPDQFVMSKEEYIKNFPYDEYDNETDSKSWEKGEKVFEKTDSAKVSGQWSVVNGKFATGFYEIEISTKDKDGEEVKDIKYIELYDEKSNQLNTPQYLWTKGAKPIEPGEKTAVKLGTSANNLFIIQSQDKGTTNNKLQTTNFSFISLNNEKKTFNFTATEADRGGYGAGWLFIKHNRVYQYNQTITVPWTNKELKIEYASFRDKTLPGSEEKWKLKISGYKNELVAAEMLASMYDASLDQFYPHNWYQPSIWPSYYNNKTWNSSQNFLKVESNQKYVYNNETKYLRKEYDYLLSNNYQYGGGNIRIRGMENMRLPEQAEAQQYALEEVVVTGYGMQKKESPMNDLVGRVAGVTITDIDKTSKELPKQIQQGAEVQIRKNFNETAFFFPDLHTDSTGAIEFSFTIPEALTKWKFQALAHTKDAAFGYSSKEIITQKQLMVQPNAPRFLREGDQMEFSAKIANLTEKELAGTATLELFDASTNKTVDDWFKNTSPNKSFTVAAGQSEVVKFPIDVPYQFNKALTWRIVAKAPLSTGREGKGEVSDGEEAAMPVLTNRMLVTETMPLPMRGAGTKNFTFDKLLQSGKSATLQNYALTVEYTSNPAWYAVQALPYLMEYPYECAEQTWNRYYANSIASKIVNSSSRIQQIFEQWKIKDTAALMSNLQKNQ